MPVAAARGMNEAATWNSLVATGADVIDGESIITMEYGRSARHWPRSHPRREVEPRITAVYAITISSAAGARANGSDSR